MANFDDQVTQYLNYISVEKALAKNTISAYRKDLERFALFLADSKVAKGSELEVNTLTEYVAWLRGKGSTNALGESSISRAVVTIRNLSNFISREVERVDHLKDFSPPKIPKRLPKALTISEIADLLKQFHGEGAANLRSLALVEVLYASGGRISEVVELKLSDLIQIEDSQTIRLTGKGGKQRVVPLGSYSREALNNYLVRSRPIFANGKTSAYLFLNSRGGKLSRQSVWKIISDAAEQAGIGQKVTPHSLRHSFATHLLDGGADIRVVQELLGHSSVTTTQIYTLVTIDRIRESYLTAHPRSK